MARPPQKTAEALLSTPVQFLKGVGPDRAKLLERLGLKTARDVIFFFPRDYEDMSDVRPIDQLREGEPVSVTGTVEEIDLRNSGVGRSVFGVLVRQGHHYLRAVWFNPSYVEKRLATGQQVLLSGQPKLAGLRWEMVHPRVQILDRGAPLPQQGTILPMYRLTEGLSQNQMRRIVRNVLDTCGAAVPEVLPDDFLDQRRLWPIRAALPQAHFPTDQASLQQARRRLVYQELLILQLAIAMRRQVRRQSGHGRAMTATSRIDARIRRLFPFALTAGQRQAIDEIVGDMGREVPMNRLLQGDVGSGKTVVAVYAMLLAVAHGFQAALMSPTEILARQHYATLQAVLSNARVRMGLLTGSLSSKQRQQTLGEIERGHIGIVVGTQAIIQKDVRFQRLGLVVIDEQHKFGVRQRAQLRQAGFEPHYLVMTATPIPRTVAMTLFGDLDVSTLRDSPPGRRPVHTYLVTESERERWWEFFRRKLREGRQGYVITPLVESTEQPAVISLEQSFETLCNGPLEEFRVDLVHGKLNTLEKEDAMDRFRRGNTQVLVATSVVEVGIDIPNANLMTVENGERFGLAQLHQLRGRVARGTYPGFFCVFADTHEEDAKQRLQALVDSTDGFDLAEFDFQMRGPGDVLGTKQHGLPPLRIADLVRDRDILEEAREAARTLVANDPKLTSPRYTPLRRIVVRRYGNALELRDVE